MATGPLPDPPEFLPNGNSAVVNSFDTIADGEFNGAHALHQPVEALRFDQAGLIAAPHRAIQGDVALDQARAEREAATVVARPTSWPE